MRTVWVDGEEEHDPECLNCNHDCPWHRQVSPPLGAPYCQVCDDHTEARAFEEEA